MARDTNCKMYIETHAPFSMLCLQLWRRAEPSVDPGMKNSRHYSSETTPPPWRSSRPASLELQQHRPHHRRRARRTAGPGRRSRPASARAARRCARARRRPARGRPAARSGSSAGRSSGWPRIGRSTAITSAASVTSVAPCLTGRWCLGARIERGARHREHLAALFERHARGDQRAGAARRLDDDHAERQSGDQPVAAREIAGARLPAERHFGDGRAVVENADRARPACSGG